MVVPLDVFLSALNLSKCQQKAKGAMFVMRLRVTESVTSGDPSKLELLLNSGRLCGLGLLFSAG